MDSNDKQKGCQTNSVAYSTVWTFIEVSGVYQVKWDGIFSERVQPGRSNAQDSLPFKIHPDFLPPKVTDYTVYPIIASKHGHREWWSKMARGDSVGQAELQN